MRTLTTLLAGCLILTMAHAAHAGQARSTCQLTVQSDYQDVIAWLDANRQMIYRATNAEIIEERSPGHFVVRSRTALGDCINLVHETTESEADTTVYRIKLTERIRGRVSDSLVVITVRNRGQETEVEMSIYINFEHRLARDRAIKRVTNESVHQLKNVLANHIG